MSSSGEPTEGEGSSGEPTELGVRMWIGDEGGVGNGKREGGGSAKRSHEAEGDQIGTLIKN